MDKVSICKFPKRIYDKLKNEECFVEIKKNGDLILFYSKNNINPFYSLRHSSDELFSELVYLENQKIAGSFDINDSYALDFTYRDLQNEEENLKNKISSNEIIKEKKIKKENKKFLNLLDLNDYSLLIAIAQTSLDKSFKLSDLDQKIHLLMDTLNYIIKSLKNNSNLNELKNYLKENRKNYDYDLLSITLSTFIRKINEISK